MLKMLKFLQDENSRLKWFFLRIKNIDFKRKELGTTTTTKKANLDENERHFYLETEITNTAVNMEKKIKVVT